VDRPVTRYARTEDDVHIAYQVLGNGPIDVVFVHAFVSHVELFWELPSYARFIRELSSWGRAIMFDKRGVGLSDRLSVVPTLEARIDDLRAVLDAVESERTLVVGNSDGGALAAMFAATYPERTLGLVLWSGGVRMAWAPDYPWGMREELFEERLSTRMELWGDEERGEETVRMTFETSERLAKDPAFVEWLPRLQRNSAAPGDLVRFSRVWFSTDARSALPVIQVPTAVFMREGWATDPVEEARWTADQIPAARLVSLSGEEDDVYLGDVSKSRELCGGSPSRSRRNTRPSTGCSRRFSSPTSSDRRSGQRRSATERGRGWSRTTTRRCGRCSAASAGMRSTRRATGSSQRSTDPGERCAAPMRSSGRWARSGSRSAQVYTPARSRRSTARPAGSP
jgi:pimeloyl-ACP methyl ester carboxylesterase